MKIRNIIISMALLTAPMFVFGQSRAVPMLEINPDARATAMGGNQYGEAQTMMIYSNPTSILYNEDVWNFSASTQIYPSADEVGRLMFYGASASRRFGIHGVHAIYSIAFAEYFFSEYGTNGKFRFLYLRTSLCQRQRLRRKRNGTD